GRAIRQRALDNLDVWLEVFERNATARGATVLWAGTPAEINADVRDIAHPRLLLEAFDPNAPARGATVLWAETPAEINAHVLDIARRHGVRKIIKSKSMVSEESELDRAIEAAGLTVVETDLGEYILQINA